MGLAYIVFSVSCSLCIAHLLKIVRREEIKIIPVLTVNYFVAASISFAQSSSIDEFVHIEPGILIFAITTGCLFIINFFLYSYSLEKNGMGVSVAAMRLSLVLPVLLSLFIYAEYLQIENYVGVALVFVALILLVPFSKSGKSFHFSMSLVLLFFLNGLVDVLLKVYDREIASALSKELFLALIFASAFFVGVIYLAIKRQLTFSVKSILYGIMIGIVNLYSSFFLLLALEKLSGALVFSATNMMNVFLGTLLGIFYWKDVLQKKQKWGLGLAIIAIILLII